MSVRYTKEIKPKLVQQFGFQIGGNIPPFLSWFRLYCRLQVKGSSSMHCTLIWLIPRVLCSLTIKQDKRRSLPTTEITTRYYTDDTFNELFRQFRR